MVLGEVFERFARSTPACVMHRAVMENIFSPVKVDALFRQTAQIQYERELLFSSLVDVMSLVVCRSSNSVHAAYVRRREQFTVSIRALYDKLSHVEVGTSRALVQYTARQAGDLIGRCKGRRQPLLKGYRTLILDGNHLCKTEHRLGVLRGTAAGALPGHSLALLDPQLMVVRDVVCCEDGHAQERTLLPDLLPSIQKRDLLIDDRNFRTLWFLFALKQRRAYFITRQHGNMPWQAVGKQRRIGRCSTGRVLEQTAEVRDPGTGKTTHLRRITVKLYSPTRDGDMEIHLLTNLPANIPTVKVAELYRKRWTLEQVFNELTVHLRCELNTLGYPKAALFAFCVAVCSYNLLATVKGALRGIHGEETMDTKVSNFFLTNEISDTYHGMMVAVPPKEWDVFQTMSPAKLAVQLRCWARTANLANYPKHPRGPKKPKKKLPNAQFQHVSTAKLLEPDRYPATRKRSKSTVAEP